MTALLSLILRPRRHGRNVLMIRDLSALLALAVFITGICAAALAISS